MIYWDHERLRNSCHLFIGRPFRDTDGAVLGEIVRTRISHDTLLVVVRMNDIGKSRRGVDELEVAAIRSVAAGPIIEHEEGPQ